ncbi:MAG TPA: RluA family pseudouridine synthase [Gemmatimonadota bacterium]|nr:RluA family pseudouridine synthase [Gemmatimonadota bacterium]
MLERAAGRVDRALAETLPLSRTRIQSLIADGRVEIDGAVVRRPSQPVPSGARITVETPPKRETSLEAEDLPLEILYEDDDCLVVDKPAGLVVHPAPGHPTGTLLHALIYHRPEVAGVGSERKAGLVHRLDRDTSGCLIVAKNDGAHERLSRQFAARTVEKMYWAFTWGHLKGDRGVFDLPIGRARHDRQRMSTRTAKGRAAITRWRVRKRYTVAEWLELELETGRTHQIRVHLSEAGHPVLGDSRYGGGPARARGFQGRQRERARAAAVLAKRQALHARGLAFDPPSGDERVRVTAPMPADLARLEAALSAPDEA